jgi:hypothetical protein
MSSKSSRHKKDMQAATHIEGQLNELIAVIRRREEECNFVDCEMVVKATVLVISGHSANEAMIECGIPVGGYSGGLN